MPEKSTFIINFAAEKRFSDVWIHFGPSKEATAAVRSPLCSLGKILY